MKNKIICTKCEDFRSYRIKNESSSLKVRGDLIEFQDKFAICETCGSKMDLEDGSDILKDVVYPKYRERHNFVTPEAMAKFRKSLGLTQKEMSILLGWGHVTLTRYENGALQDDAHDSAFQMAMNPHGFRILLLKHGKEIPNIKIKKLQAWAMRDLADIVKSALANLKDEIKKQLQDHTYQTYQRQVTEIVQMTTPRGKGRTQVLSQKAKYSKRTPFLIGTR